MEQLARELEERQRQELERLKEEEELKKKSRRGRRETGKEKDSVSGKKSQPGVRQVGGWAIAVIVTIPEGLIQCFEILTSFPLPCPECHHVHQQHQRVHQQPLRHQRRVGQKGVYKGAPGLCCR